MRNKNNKTRKGEEKPPPAGKEGIKGYKEVTTVYWLRYTPAGAGRKVIMGSIGFPELIIILIIVLILLVLLFVLSRRRG